MPIPVVEDKSSRLAHVFGHIVATAHDPDVSPKETAERARTFSRYFKAMATPLLALTLQEIDRQRWSYLLVEKTGKKAIAENAILDKLMIFREKLEKETLFPVDPDSPRIKNDANVTFARAFGDAQRVCYTSSEEEAEDGKWRILQEGARNPFLFPALIKEIQVTQNWESANFLSPGSKKKNILERREYLLADLKAHWARVS